MARKLKIIRQYGVVTQHGEQKPVRIVIHTTEGDSASPTIFPQDFGAHYVVAQDGTIYNYVPDNQIAYGTGGNNTGTIDIEIVGHAKFSAADWKKRASQIASVSGLIGLLSKKYSIPVTLSTSRGVSTHAMNSKLYAASEGHWDPGPGFPLKQVLSAARSSNPTAIDGGQPTAPATPTTPVPPSEPPTYPTSGQNGGGATNTPPSGTATSLTPIQPVSTPPLPTDLPVPGVNVAMPGSVSFAPHSLAALWQSVAQDDFVSPDTQRLITNSQLAAGG